MKDLVDLLKDISDCYIEKMRKVRGRRRRRIRTIRGRGSTGKKVSRP